VRNLLFTKETSPGFLKQHLSPNIDFDTINFLEIETYPKEKIISELDRSIENYLITSQNSVKAIKDLEFKGEFYAVGSKTAALLEKNGFRVKVHRNYASELADYILQNETKKKWMFFCGNNRREVLFEKLVPEGHYIQQILCYDSIPVTHNLNGKVYDAIAFFSPLGVKYYLKKNVFSPETVIFTIGKTTSEEVEIYTKNKIITAEIPILESVIQSINKYFYVEK